MIEKLINIIFNELNKHNTGRSCLLASNILTQHISNSEIR